ncbi:DUF3788 family protein [Bacteroidota bacterium]
MKVPDNKMLSTAIGKTMGIYDGIIEFLNHEYGNIRPEWKNYGKNYGWTLKVFHKKRNLFFIMPCSGYFKISFVFGKRAVAEVEKSDLPEDIIKTLLDARQYAEGKGLQLEVRLKKDLKIIKKLIEIKVKT